MFLDYIIKRNLVFQSWRGVLFDEFLNQFQSLFSFSTSMIMYVTPSPLLHVNLLLTTFGQVKNVTCTKKSKQMKLLFEKSSSAGTGARTFYKWLWVECGSPSLIKKTNNLALCCSNKSLSLERATQRYCVCPYKWTLAVVAFPQRKNIDIARDAYCSKQFFARRVSRGDR